MLASAGSCLRAGGSTCSASCRGPVRSRIAAPDTAAARRMKSLYVTLKQILAPKVKVWSDLLSTKTCWPIILTARAGQRRPGNFWEAREEGGAARGAGTHGVHNQSATRTQMMNSGFNQLDQWDKRSLGDHRDSRYFLKFLFSFFF